MQSQSDNASGPPGEHKGRCLYLMVSLLVLLLVHPFFSRGPVGQTLLLLLNSGTLVAGIYSVRGGAGGLIVSQVTIAV